MSSFGPHQLQNSPTLHVPWKRISPKSFAQSLDGEEKETDVLQIKGLASDLPLTPNSKALNLHQSSEGLIQGADLAHLCLLIELDPDKATS